MSSIAPSIRTRLCEAKQPPLGRHREYGEQAHSKRQGQS
jgi:hypothetical protein